MNASELIAILVLMAAGGGIAYLGDWIGLTVGKRRLTIFKLRPRNTAKVFTVVAGALIALVTFVILLGVNRGFSIAVQNGAQILHRNHELTRANRLLKQNADAAEAEVEQARADAASARLKTSAAETDLRQVNTKLTQSHAAFVLAKQQLTVKQAQVARTESALGAATVQLENARHQGILLTQQNDQTRKRIKTFISQFLQPTFNSQTQNALVYRNGQEIGRIVISANQPIAVIRQQIYGFLGQLSAEALVRGAVRGSNKRGVVIGPIAGETANIAALADSIHGYHNDNDKVVVIAHVLENAFVGEQFVIALSPHADLLAIRQGTTLAALTIQPSEKQDPALILSEVQRLLVQSRLAAGQAGVIPVMNPQVHEAQFGDEPLVDLFNVVDQVRQISGPALVTVKAAKDTYAADQLKLTFTVTSAPPAASAASSSN